MLVPNQSGKDEEKLKKKKKKDGFNQALWLKWIGVQVLTATAMTPTLLTVDNRLICQGKHWCGLSLAI